jgi:hypothetical protein
MSAPNLGMIFDLCALLASGGVAVTPLGDDGALKDWGSRPNSPNQKRRSI